MKTKKTKRGNHTIIFGETGEKIGVWLEKKSHLIFMGIVEEKSGRESAAFLTPSQALAVASQIVQAINEQGKARCQK